MLGDGKMYDKKLKRGKDGQVVRYIGTNDKGTPEKFRLGYDLPAAEERLKLIAALWHELEEAQSRVINRSGSWITLKPQRRLPRGCPQRCPGVPMKTRRSTFGVL